MRRILCSLCFLSLVLHSGDIRAQQLQQAHNDDACDHPAGQVELFCGAELNYADINYLRLYDVLINLTPSVKWHLGHDWQVSGQVFLPFVNEGYAKRYEMIRLNMANVSKEFHFEKYAKLFLEVLFSVLKIDAQPRIELADADVEDDDAKNGEYQSDDDP